jgi:NADH-quinone oxidoreductase subunit N
MNNIFATSTDVLMTLPLMVLLLTGAVLMMLDAFKLRNNLALVAMVGIVASIVLALPPVLEAIAGPLQATSFQGMIATGKMASAVHILLGVSGVFTLFFLGDFMKRQAASIPDSYTLILFAMVGMDLLANANDLMITFIGLETMSICLYVMAAMYKKDPRSNESGLKYFLLGAFATGFFLYGIALIYGAAGSTNFDTIEANWLSIQASGLFYPGIGLMLVGFLFKVSAFPFHAWTPDVYTGTPTPLAGFMSTGAKSAAFIALATFFAKGPLAADEKFQTVLIVVAVATMAYGNFVAARQKDMKRLLAYSSIAHSGYILLAVAAGAEGLDAVVFYTFIYTLMNIGAFGMIAMAENHLGDTSVDSWKGFGRANPWLGAALAIFLFSLAGIPPFAGFMGKYFVFAAAIKAGLVVPAVLGILTSVVGAFYYINLVKGMYFDDKDKPVVTVTSAIVPIVGVVVLVVLLVVLGVFPGLVQGFLNESISGGMLPDFAAIAPQP